MLGHAAIEAGHHVSWFSLEDLGALLHRHCADDSIRLTQATRGKGVKPLA